MEPSFSSRSEIEAWRRWAQSKTNPTPSIHGSNLKETDWEIIKPPSGAKSPYKYPCNSCRRIR